MYIILMHNKLQELEMNHSQQTIILVYDMLLDSHRGQLQLAKCSCPNPHDP